MRPKNMFEQWSDKRPKLGEFSNRRAKSEAWSYHNARELTAEMTKSGNRSDLKSVTPSLIRERSHKDGQIRGKSLDNGLITGLLTLEA